MSNDDFSQIKTRIHVLQQTGKKGHASILRVALLHTGNPPEEAVCSIALVHRGKDIYVL